MNDEYIFCCVLNTELFRWQQIADFLRKNNLDIDPDIEQFIIALDDAQQIVACGGIAGRVLKCIAIDPQLRGQGLALTLMTTLINQAFTLQRYELFLYTKPENEALFTECGFHLLAKVDGQVILMENSATRLQRYCRHLTELRREGDVIGAIVMNANPFTLGHRYLVQQACKECDWVHLFVVQENASEFPYEDRLALIKAGVSDLGNLTIHPGSDYLISRATFPSYFLKDQKIINECHMALDLQLFRNAIAPALGIQRRYVGTEPLCPVTAQYNQAMAYWLTTPSLPSPALELHEIERRLLAKEPISACRVRTLLAQQGPAAVKGLVPESTYRYLWQHYAPPQRISV
ncbi:[citrate (pro-3S)-lyase] ligase [Tolumonas osonensis]|uniref:[Citrate [pro-3S]-lyase] ligase n=1 Tax=Tolumonas osonensis TaxID=675874 RepID=A0A841G5W6_9GAMM|nr:[citrate (pro-3S)-lyase] ligase [Tolumonas osonensis]MBB6054534.1 [citrate (pro-3S)-lyase] ligase [Tolumonas osonensis]